MRRIPNFVLVRTFEAAARLESFSRAAEELNVTPSAVSHQIQELESFIGHRLFDRARRRVQLTPIGDRLYDDFAKALDLLEMACQGVVQPSQQQALTVHCSPTFAVKWLGPRLRSFLDEHPGLSLKLSSSPGGIDLREHPEVDVAITYGRTVAHPGIKVTGLGAETIAPLFSPAMRERFADERSMLSQATLIESQLNPIRWLDWFRAGDIESPSPDRLSFDRATLSIAAAVDALGVALESTRLAEREIAGGQLIVGAEGPPPILCQLHFLSVRENEQRYAKVVAFTRWMSRELDLA